MLHQRPDTKWRPVLSTNVIFRIYRTGYVLGHGGVQLPKHVVNCRSIIGLTKDQSGRMYTDNKCLFRCLALHKGRERNDLEPTVEHDFHKWVEHALGGDETLFEGVTMDELSLFEQLFQVNIHIFFLNKDLTSQLVRSSPTRHMLHDQLNNLYANLYENHLSYISNPSTYCKKFKCDTCDKQLPSHAQWSKHFRTCRNETKTIHCKGFYSHHQTVFEKLDELSIHVEEDLRFFPWFATYDFECYLSALHDEQSGKKLVWTHRHTPLSVSSCSNVNGYLEPVCEIEREPDELVEKFVDDLLDIQAEVSRLARIRWEHVYTELERRIALFKPEQLSTSNTSIHSPSSPSESDMSSNQSELQFSSTIVVDDDDDDDDDDDEDGDDHDDDDDDGEDDDGDDGDHHHRGHRHHHHQQSNHSLSEEDLLLREDILNRPERVVRSMTNKLKRMKKEFDRYC